MVIAALCECNNDVVIINTIGTTATLLQNNCFIINAYMMSTIYEISSNDNVGHV